jgi:hypothetical protein
MNSVSNATTASSRDRATELLPLIGGREQHHPIISPI